MATRKRTNNDLQNVTQKTEDPATLTTLNPWVNTGAPEGLEVPAPHGKHVLLLLNDMNII